MNQGRMALAVRFWRAPMFGWLFAGVGGLGCFTSFLVLSFQLVGLGEPDRESTGEVGWWPAYVLVASLWMWVRGLMWLGLTPWAPKVMVAYAVTGICLTTVFAIRLPSEFGEPTWSTSTAAAIAWMVNVAAYGGLRYFFRRPRMKLSFQRKR